MMTRDYAAVRLEPSRSEKGVAQLAVSALLLEGVDKPALIAVLLDQFVRACDAPGVPHGAEVFPSLDPDDYTLEQVDAVTWRMDLRERVA